MTQGGVVMQSKTELAVPQGFSFSAAEANIRKTGRKDLALIVSETEAVMSGVFTTNRVKANRGTSLRY